MIPATRWRRVAQGVVVAATVLVALSGAALHPELLPLAAGPLALATWWAVRRPGGWGPLALLVVDVFHLAVTRGAPETVTDWALAAVCGAALLATQLACALLAAWPPRAALPTATARRWLTQGGVLAAATGAAAVVGVLGTATPVSWRPWVGAAALGLVGVVAVQVNAATRRRR